jgi:hypothetical protein
MLCRLAGRLAEKSRLEFRQIGREYEIDYIKNRTLSVTRSAGSLVSLVPLSSTVRYSCRGTDYTAREVILRPGQTLALRNRIVAQRASFTVRGEALLVRQVVAKQRQKAS